VANYSEIAAEQPLRGGRGSLKGNNIVEISVSKADVLKQEAKRSAREKKRAKKSHA
jgi:hypothetical protein